MLNFNAAIFCLLIIASFSTSSGDASCEFDTDTEVKCKNAEGTFLKDAGSKDVNTIYISKCDLAELTTEDFLAFPSLTLVSIQKSYITFPIHEHFSFEGLRKLKDLRIENSNATEEVKQLFAKNNDITSLSLRGNKISVITNEFFGHLHQIKYIDLSENEIEYIEIGVFERLNTLRTLNLASNRLGFSFDPQFLTLTTLTCIVCRANNIEKCTEDDVTRCKVNIQIDQLWWKTNSLDHINLKNNLVCAAIASDYRKPNLNSIVKATISNITLNNCKTGLCFKHESRKQFLLEACNEQNSETQFVGRDTAMSSTVDPSNITVKQNEGKTEDEEHIKLSIASITSLLGVVAVFGILIGFLVSLAYNRKNKSPGGAHPVVNVDPDGDARDPMMGHVQNVDSRLHDAIMKTNIKKVTDLLASGVDPNSQDEKGELPIHYAARAGNDKIIKELGKYSTDMNAKNRDGEAAIHSAVGRGNLFTVICLFNNGSDINVQNRDGNTPLLLAVKDGHIDIARYLILNGADVNSRNNFKQLPIHFAAKNGHTNVLQLLISKRSNCGPRDNRRYTPLHYAAQRGYIDIAKKLLEEGENVDVRNSSQNTPLHKAAKAGQTNMIEFLLEKNADVQATNFKGQMPHIIARLQRHKICARLLQQRLEQILNQSGTRM